MRPIEFELKKSISQTPKEISAQIADTENWNDFNGYAFLPGIEKAKYEKRTDEIAGSRIRVKNRDGSEHTEEVLEWDSEKKIVLKLHEFSPPLNRLASHFIEEWNFVEKGKAKTFITRKFQLFPKSVLAKPFLWTISIFFKKAIAQHLNEMENETRKK